MVLIKKIMNNLYYNKTSTLLEDQYFREKLEQLQTPFTVYQFSKIYTGTFTFMLADKTWPYDPKRNPLHNFPVHHQIEVNLISWRLAISEIELTNNDTENVMINDGHITIHMPQKWNLSKSVKCTFRETRANRILVKQCIVFIANCVAECNQEYPI